jgi:hypothetical protein
MKNVDMEMVECQLGHIKEVHMSYAIGVRKIPADLN